MSKLLTRAYISMKTRADAFVQDFNNDERGVSAIVATILLMLIVVLMVAVFYEQISGWFAGIMEKIFGTADATKFNEDAFKKTT